MKTNVYTVHMACPALKAELIRTARPIKWRMVAHSKESAWSKFCFQYFRKHALPDPADYWIELKEYQVELTRSEEFTV